REMAEIVRRAKKEKDTRFHYGEAEQKLMAYLGMNPHITLDQFRALARLSRFQASRKLILLVLARVLQILPTEKGDLYLPR
ncbi:MAG: ATP-binding protein, partial [Cyclobacteriaceae bacterium]